MSLAVNPDATLRIGARLRAHRDQHRLSPDDLAERLGISRAALYRAEKGEIAKLEVLGRIAVELGASLDQLLGVGAEYLDDAAVLFQRMAELEAEADCVTGVFSPVAYLLTSPDYDRMLKDALFEQAQATPERIARVMEALRRRRRTFAAGRLRLRSIVTAVDLERFLAQGLTGRSSLPAPMREARRRHARAEVEAIARLALAPPPGGQAELRLLEAPGAITSFEVVSRPEATWLVISPFALGVRPNITLGVGVVTRTPEAVASHKAVTERLWSEGIGGEAAHARIQELLARTG